MTRRNSGKDRIKVFDIGEQGTSSAPISREETRAELAIKSSQSVQN